MSRNVALVTGGGTGVGRACVLKLAERGWDVVLNYSRSQKDAETTAEQARARGIEVFVHACDVSDDASVRQMIATIGSRLGRLDVVINNAAMTHFVDHHDLEGMTEPKWDRILAVNLKGPFFVSRAAATLLSASECGAIVNVSSIAGETGKGSSIAYCASKAGLNAMTRSLARVLAPRVRVNAVCPGPIDSRWIREGNPDWDLDKMVANLPIPRASQPADVADAVLFLALDAKMVTGQLLGVDGGATL